MSRRSATLVVLALSIETMCVAGRMSRFPEIRATNNPTEIVAVEKPKSRSAA